MRIRNNTEVGNLITLKDKTWLKRQKYAGRVLASLHREFFSMMRGRSENITLNTLGDIADEVIKKNDCTPTFLGYNGFPGVICTSLNKEIVHGFPRDIALQDGDVVKVDIGVTFEGAIADCAVTYVYGKAKSPDILRLLVSCQGALNDGIAQVKPGNKLGEVGKAIWDRGKADKFGVIIDYGGHGIDYNRLHAPPFVANKAKATEGPTLRPGMSIAIEPMFVLGKNTNTKILKDKWAIATRDIGAHFEHSVTLDEDGTQHIITDHGVEAKDFV